LSVYFDSHIQMPLYSHDITLEGMTRRSSDVHVV